MQKLGCLPDGKVLPIGSRGRPLQEGLGEEGWGGKGGGEMGSVSSTACIE